VERVEPGARSPAAAKPRSRASVVTGDRTSTTRLVTQGSGDDAGGTLGARMTDSQLANDRTFLAWLRTGIALFGLGFVVSKVSFIVQPGAGGASDEALYSIAGVLIVLCGAALVVVGFRQHATLAAILDAEAGTAPARWPRTVAIGSVIGALLLAALIVVTT
jgi:putative membrane protein